MHSSMHSEGDEGGGGERTYRLHLNDDPLPRGGPWPLDLVLRAFTGETTREGGLRYCRGKGYSAPTIAGRKQEGGWMGGRQESWTEKWTAPQTGRGQ